MKTVSPLNDHMILDAPEPEDHQPESLIQSIINTPKQTPKEHQEFVEKMRAQVTASRNAVTNTSKGNKP